MTVQQAINSDWRYVLGFIVDNNPEAVQSNLDGLGLLSTPPQSTTREDLLTVLYTLDEPTLSEVTAVPYVNEAENYTGGYQRELEADAQNRSFVLALITGITTLGAGFFNMQNSENQSDIAQTQYDIVQAQIELAEQNQIWGLPKEVVIAIVASLALIIIVFIIKKVG